MKHDYEKLYDIGRVRPHELAEAGKGQPAGQSTPKNVGNGPPGRAPIAALRSPPAMAGKPHRHQYAARSRLTERWYRSDASLMSSPRLLILRNRSASPSIKIRRQRHRLHRAKAAPSRALLAQLDALRQSESLHQHHQHQHPLPAPKPAAVIGWQAIR